MEVIQRAGDMLPSSSPDRLTGAFTYQNFEGITYSASMWAVFRQVVNHGTCHRGQVASKLTRRGVDPPGADLVY